VEEIGRSVEGKRIERLTLKSLAGDCVFLFFCELEGAWLNARVIPLRLVTGRTAVEG
jgi:hypothetical protein